MKYLKVINILPISFFIFALLALPAMAATHTMTGNIYTDWGVDLNKAYNGDYTGWIPASKSADWVIENNIYSPLINQYSGAYPDWTGYRSTGFHMQKNGLMKDPEEFKEKAMMSGTYLSPSGGEPYDIEALYFDNDKNNMYIAIVTSMNQSGYTETSPWDNYKGICYRRYTEAGDIAIDLDNSSSGSQEYEYGVIIHNDTTPSDSDKTFYGHLIYKPKWTLPQSSDGFLENAPSDCDKFTYSADKGPISLNYTKLNINEKVDYGTKGTRDVPKYLIEVSIPRNKIGNPPDETLSNIHITIGCGNDVVELEPVRFKTDIPEFPSIALPVAAIMGVMFIFGRRNKE